MIDKLKLAGDQLRAAWDNYFQVYSNLGNYYAQAEAPVVPGFPSEICGQLDTELDFISSYEPKIQQIRVAIGGARNYSFSITPINTLPPEILARIFLLVLARPCEFENLGTVGHENNQYFTNSDILAQVCVFWRKTAIASCSLWRHIDLSSYAPSYGGLVRRAWTYVARAGDLPLELHISERINGDSERSEYGYHHLCTFISHISSRVETLEFLVGGYFQDFHRRVLESLVLGENLTLKRFVLRTIYHHHNSFIFSGYAPPGIRGTSADFRVGSIGGEVEAFFASLTMLYLRGVFPIWSSKAYHGLVDLRLRSTDNWSHIKAVDLTTVLKSSPGLRILHFSLVIDDPASDPRDIDPVYLQDLQVVKIFPLVRDNYDYRNTLCPSKILQLLAPGSNPLRLSLNGHYKPHPFAVAEIERFLSRSRVVMFHARVVSPPMSALLRHATYIDRIILEDLNSQTQDELAPNWSQVDESIPRPSLGTLHIIRSELCENHLRLLSNCCPSNTLIQSCNIYHGNDGTRVDLSSRQVSEAFPAVKTVERRISSSEDLTTEWDVLD